MFDDEPPPEIVGHQRPIKPEENDSAQGSLAQYTTSSDSISGDFQLDKPLDLCLINKHYLYERLLKKNESGTLLKERVSCQQHQVNVHRAEGSKRDSSGYGTSTIDQRTSLVQEVRNYLVSNCSIHSKV